MQKYQVFQALLINNDTSSKITATEYKYLTEERMTSYLANAWTKGHQTKGYSYRC